MTGCKVTAHQRSPSLPNFIKIVSIQRKLASLKLPEAVTINDLMLECSDIDHYITDILMKIIRLRNIGHSLNYHFIHHWTCPS